MKIPTEICKSEIGIKPEKVHESGNEFAKTVGALLKAHYPAKVVEVRATFSIVNGPPINIGPYRIDWYARIEKTDSANADYYFDRRGTLLSGPSEASACNAVETELQMSKKVQSMMDDFDKAFGGHRMPKEFVTRSTACQSFEIGSDMWWCLEEYFCTSPKLKESPE